MAENEFIGLICRQTTLTEDEAKAKLAKHKGIGPHLHFEQTEDAVHSGRPSSMAF